MSQMSRESGSEELLRLARERRVSRGRVRSGTLDPESRRTEVDRLRDINERGRTLASVENREIGDEVRQNRIAAGAEIPRISPEYTRQVRESVDAQRAAPQPTQGRISRRFEQAREFGRQFADRGEAARLGVTDEQYGRLAALRGTPGGPEVAGSLAAEGYRDNAMAGLKAELDAKYAPDAVDAAARRFMAADYQTGTERLDEMSMKVRGRPSAGTMGQMLSADQAGSPLRLRGATGELTPIGGNPGAGETDRTPLLREPASSQLTPLEDRPQYAGADEVRAGRVAQAQRALSEDDARVARLRRQAAEFNEFEAPRREFDARIGAQEAETAATQAQAAALAGSGAAAAAPTATDQIGEAYDLESIRQIARSFDVSDNLVGPVNPQLARTRIERIATLPEPQRSQQAQVLLQAILDTGYSPGVSFRPGVQGAGLNAVYADLFRMVQALANPQAEAAVPEGDVADRIRR